MLPLGFPCGSAGKESACNEGDLVSVTGWGRSPGERKGYSPQYSGLENSRDYAVHGVTKSRTQLSDFHFHLLYWNATRVICLHITYGSFMLQLPKLLLSGHLKKKFAKPSLRILEVNSLRDSLLEKNWTKVIIINNKTKWKCASQNRMQELRDI